MFHFELYPKSVNGDKFAKFLKVLRRKHGQGKMYIYMDNLKVHMSKPAKKAFIDYDVTPIWAPVYSPEYNPIENVFSKLKIIVKNMRLTDMVNKRKRLYPELVPLAVK